jgi:hypothetical protein
MESISAASIRPTRSFSSGATVALEGRFRSVTSISGMWAPGDSIDIVETLDAWNVSSMEEPLGFVQYLFPMRPSAEPMRMRISTASHGCPANFDDEPRWATIDDCRAPNLMTKPIAQQWAAEWIGYGKHV